MKELFIAPIHCIRLLLRGSITFETSVAVGGGGGRDEFMFQTIMELNGDTLNKIPNPRLFPDSGWKKAWTDAAERHQKLTDAGSRYIAFFPRCLYWIAVFCIGALLVYDILAPLLIDPAEFMRNTRTLFSDLTMGTASAETIRNDIFQLCRGPFGVLLFFIRKKLISLFLKLVLAISKSVIWTWIKRVFSKRRIKDRSNPGDHGNVS